jgi:hypothetical protein
MRLYAMVMEPFPSVSLIHVAGEIYIPFVLASRLSRIAFQGFRQEYGDAICVCHWHGGNFAKIDIHTLKTTIILLPRPDAQQTMHATRSSQMHS